MNSPLFLVLASVAVTSMRSGCDRAQPGMALHMGTDPEAFGQQFTAVCKVGERGGDGTLIAPEWVLTAAHVAEGMHRRDAEHLKVQFENGAVHNVLEVFLHPTYEPMGHNDIALLHLDGPVTGVEPVTCYSGSDELGRSIIIVGHGDRRNPDGTWIKDGRLRAYTNTIDAVDETQIIFDYDAPGSGATDQEGTSGPGDSGGPAFIGTQEQIAVAGISSMGEPGTDGPCSYGAVEHFVRVSQFQQWISAVMNDPDAHVALASAGEAVYAEPLDTAAITSLGNPARERATQRIAGAFASGKRMELEAAIGDTYAPAILAKRDAPMIMCNMPALVEQLSGAHLVGVIGIRNDRISLKMTKDGQNYALDLFFGPTDKIEQMAFGRIDQGPEQ